MEDIVGDIEEEDVCTWSEQDWIEDISENIAEEVIEWLEPLKKLNKVIILFLASNYYSLLGCILERYNLKKLIHNITSLPQ